MINYMVIRVKENRIRTAILAKPFSFSRGGLFLFLKGVARQGRALISDTYRLECLHSQMDVALISIWCSAPTPFIKLFSHLNLEIAKKSLIFAAQKLKNMFFICV